MVKMNLKKKAMSVGQKIKIPKLELKRKKK